MRLEELKDEDRTLVVVALQALHRERLTASNAALRSASWPEKPRLRMIFLDYMKCRTRCVVLVQRPRDKSGIKKRQEDTSSLPSK